MARIRPRQVALWSFTVALLHGAGLMLVPMLLGLCAPSPGPNPFVGTEAGLPANAGLVLAVATAHTGALVAAGGLLAFVAYRVLGLELLTRSWFDVSHLWAASLAIAGALGAWSAL
jgi:hypothetical protein